MNKKQMTVAWVVLGILFVLSLFPMRESTDGNMLKRGFAFTQELQGKRLDGGFQFAQYSKIDIETTIAQMLPVVIIGIGLILTFNDKSRS